MNQIQHINTHSDLITLLSQCAAILFDLDGTLFNLHVPWQQIRQDITEDYQNQYHQSIPNEKNFYSIFNFIKTHQGISVFNRYLKFLESQENIAVLKHTSESLWLVNTGLYRIANFIRFDTFYGIVSSNFHKNILEVLKPYGLQERFKIIIGRDDVSEMKPNPEGLNQVLVSYNLEPSQVLFIGDLSSDEEAAQRANIHFLNVDKFQKLLLNS